jgi:hypothetical protein
LYNQIQLFDPVAAGKIFVAKMIVKPDDCLCLELRPLPRRSEALLGR